jgi:hypothetical protein
MPLSGQCSDAHTAIIYWKLGGDIIYTSGVFFIDILDHEISQISALGQIVNIVVMDSNGEVIDCCPDGYHYDPQQLACMPGVPEGPAPPPQCPPGFHWDDLLQSCVPDVIPIPVPIPEPEPPEGGGGCCDDDFNQQLGAIMYAIYRVLVEILAAERKEKPVPLDECCVKLVAGLTAIANAINIIAIDLTKPGPPPPTPPSLTPIVDALDAINTTLGEMNGKPPLDLTPVVEAIDRQTAVQERIEEDLRSALNATPVLPPDPRAKVKAMADYLVANYAFDAGAAQIVTG